MTAASSPLTPNAAAPVALAWTDLLAKRRPFGASGQMPLVMGILNVTPDSFSDGGRFIAPEKAIAHARKMIAQGADLIDLGAESTRPYGDALPVSADEEIARLSPVLPAVAELGVPMSIDTMKAKVADWALAHGANIINDVWGLQRDPDMAKVARAHGAPVVAMHNRDSADDTRDIMADMDEFFVRTLARADEAGIARAHMMLDPGIGFGKTPRQSLIALARWTELTHHGLPFLIGASRKRFIATVTPSEPQDRIGGSLAAHLLAARKGAAIVRVHDVAQTVQALRVHAAIEEQS